MKRLFLISFIALAVGAGVYALILRRTNNDAPSSKSLGQNGLTDADGISEITLERERCYGACPVYKVTLRRDGSASYSGKENVTRIGEYKSQALPYQPIGAEFIRLANLIASQGFLKMNDHYTAALTDSATVITSVVHDGKRKTIVNYANQGPIELYGIEMAIDGVAAQIKWEEEKPDRR